MHDVGPVAAVLVAASVFVGGVLGGYCRWALTRVIRSQRLATLIANLIASAIIGFSVNAPGMLQISVGVGFAGALSTLALLARQLGELIKDRDFRAMFIYGGVTAIGSVIAAACGLLLGYDAVQLTPRGQ